MWLVTFHSSGCCNWTCMKQDVVCLLSPSVVWSIFEREVHFVLCSWTSEMPLENMNIISSLCCWILLLCLQKNVSCCDSTDTLTSEEGEDVILQVNQTLSRLSFITWNFETHIIATTGPGQTIELGKYSDRYPGRLFSTNDGSLVITGLTAEDGQIYRAEHFDGNWSYLCVQLYDVRTDGRDGPSPNVESSESCSPTQQIFSGLGENVTLRLPPHSRVAEAVHVVWDDNNIDHIAITRPGGILSRESDSHRGKVSATGDGSLRLSNLTTKDQQVYRAELFTEEWGYLCIQHFDVRVKNLKLMGSPGKIITTTTYRKQTAESSFRGLRNYIRLALSACVLLATFSILVYHVKTENSRTPASPAMETQA